ncbi:leucine-rich repeat receptor-like serine/threonine-protein kinase At1g17230 isoform X2 [Carya illinoinensis]|uniref:leucine-rich repeat receptor-like serine/threonine-protein kinase At1g17230 isoform X2 n=1 Tax=Carya illinoinensis TaxID=32201 RepID=UPI001C726F66|nr:leucine-rich repeat receptor-like serine/threonine-protein kinase At1g17230 isoform X2 [Carya illinoinensis]
MAPGCVFGASVTRIANRFSFVKKFWISSYGCTELTVQVMEKCNVFSFGVVALEVMMGRYPRELLVSLSSSQSTAAISVSGSAEFLLKDVLDQRLPTQAGKMAEAVVFVVSIALLCVRDNPLSRVMDSHALCGTRTVRSKPGLALLNPLTLSPLASFPAQKN